VRCVIPFRLLRATALVVVAIMIMIMIIIVVIIIMPLTVFPLGWQGNFEMSPLGPQEFKEGDEKLEEEFTVAAAEAK
jgi:hypothetical protein